MEQFIINMCYHIFNNSPTFVFIIIIIKRSHDILDGSDERHVYTNNDWTTTTAVWIRVCMRPWSVVRVSEWASKDKSISWWCGYYPFYITTYALLPNFGNVKILGDEVEKGKNQTGETGYEAGTCFTALDSSEKYQFQIHFSLDIN